MTGDTAGVEIEREFVTFTLVCDGCGAEWDNQGEWLEDDPCMPDRGQA